MAYIVIIMSKTIFSIIESSVHPDFSALYASLNISETRFNSLRKTINNLKLKPDFIVAEFFYGYGNNYAGVNVSNLDVMLHSLPKYSSASKVIVLVSKEERQFVDKLAALFPLHAILQLPVSNADMQAALLKE